VVGKPLNIIGVVHDSGGTISVADVPAPTIYSLTNEQGNFVLLKINPFQHFKMQ